MLCNFRDREAEVFLKHNGLRKFRILLVQLPADSGNLKPDVGLLNPGIINPLS